VTGLKRIMMLAVIWASVSTSGYNTVIVDTFYNAPAQLPQRSSAQRSVATVDASEQRRHGGGKPLDEGLKLDQLEQRRVLRRRHGGLVPDGTALCLCHVPDSAFQHRARRAARARPLFIAMLFFEATRRMFSAWIAQLANYALITILTVMVAALLLQLVQSYAARPPRAAAPFSPWTR